MKRPEFFVLSGPNGAGKSTTATVLLPESLNIEHFVNADLLAMELPYSGDAAAFEAGRTMLERIHRLRQERVSFAIETTLAARSYVAFLREAQNVGYFVHIVYIWLSSVELACTRVAARVRQGGHDVPRHVIKARYDRGLWNFFHLYQPVADSWALCDNSGDDLLIVARGSLGEDDEVLRPEIYARIRQ